MLKSLLFRPPEKEPHSLNSPEIYAAISKEGISEMRRPTSSLFWSALAAGILVSFSLICKAALFAEFDGLHWQHALASSGYTIGFVMVMYAKLQLFTENTISPVLPTILKPTPAHLLSTLRIWGISLSANFLGTALIALCLIKTPMFSSDTVSAALHLSREVQALGFGETLAKGVPAGLLIASLVWSRATLKGADFPLIFLVTYLIGLGGFTHVVVGSTELFALVWNGEAAFGQVFIGNVLPALLGNVIGGTGLFALIAWAQIKEEMPDRKNGDTKSADRSSAGGQDD